MTETSTALFTYDDAVLTRFPTIRAGVLHAVGLDNRPTPPALLDAYQAEQRAVAARLPAAPIAERASIAAWRRVFTGFGAKPTQHRNAVEALLRRLGKQGDIPSINTLVDAGNLVSIRHGVPVAVFDLAGVAAPITVRFATGDEPFTDLGSTGTVPPPPGEVVFVDRDGVVCARRWCWRQSAQSATGPSTTEALVVIEAHHDTAGQDVGQAVQDLADLLATHQPRATLRTGTAPAPTAPSATAR